ncbi:MAG: uracil-DNA glycosylase [Pyrinomonadaceae bacterium]
MSSLSEEIEAIAEQTKRQLRHLQTLGIESIRLTRSTKTPTTSKQQPQARIASETVSPSPITMPSGSAPATLFAELRAPTQQLGVSDESFEQIWMDVGDCTRCPLHRDRTNIVHSEGNRKARLMFVGEAPGADEDDQARPFVGRAGQLLTKIIESIGFKREEVLIANVNRCRPPGNRQPTPEEVSMCKPFLLREIAIVQPEVIVVLGNTAMRNLLGLKEGITKVRGKFQDYKTIRVMPTYHPAFLLRDPSKKRETWEDLKKVRDYLESTKKIS